MKFRISPQYDIRGYFMLKKSWMKTANFHTTIFSKFPLNERPRINMKIGMRDERSLVSTFVENQYKIHRLTIKRELKKIERAWKKKNKKFFNLARKFFDDHQKLHQIYITYPSIWPLNLRSVSKRQVSFPYNKGVNHALFVISHELLHIFFYNHLYRRFKNIRSTILSKKAWSFSEVLNVLIQNERAWTRLTGLRARPYPQHKRLYKQMSAYWKRNHNIDDMIIRFLKKT